MSEERPEYRVAPEFLRRAADIMTERGKQYDQPGAPGECELCGEWSGHLVRGACAPCRDRYKLP